MKVYDSSQAIYPERTAAYHTQVTVSLPWRARLVGPVVKAYASRSADVGFIPTFAVDLLPG